MKSFIDFMGTRGINEDAAADLKKWDNALKSELGIPSSRKSGRNEFEYKLKNKQFHVDFFAGDDEFVTVYIGNEEHDVSKDKNMIANIAKYINTKIK